jgi:hypothetical protein
VLSWPHRFLAPDPGPADADVRRTATG